MSMALKCTGAADLGPQTVPQGRSSSLECVFIRASGSASPGHRRGKRQREKAQKGGHRERVREDRGLLEGQSSRLIAKGDKVT